MIKNDNVGFHETCHKSPPSSNELLYAKKQGKTGYNFERSSNTLG
jgi:hypothetical protein